MEKQEKIVSMFNNIAPTYDKANRVLSMGIDKSWRDKACNKTFELYGKKEIEKIDVEREVLCFLPWSHIFGQVW